MSLLLKLLRQHTTHAPTEPSLPLSVLHSVDLAKCQSSRCQHLAVQQFLYSIYSDPSWVLRRIETVRFIDLHKQERKVTLDISWESLTERANTFGIDGYRKLPIILSILHKGLLLDIDVIGEHGRPLAVLPSTQDSAAAQFIILQNFDRMAAHDPVVQSHAYAVALAPMTKSATIPPITDRTTTQNATKDLEFFSQNFLFMVEIEPNAPTFIVKFKIVDPPSRPSRRSFREALCLTSQDHYIEAQTIGHSQRHHLRVVAPEGLFIDWIQLFYDGIEPDTVSKSTYQCRKTPERAVIYTAGLPRADYSVFVGMRPRPAGTFTAALCLSLALLGSTVAGIVGECWGKILTNPSGQISAAPILGALVSVFALATANILRNDEHEFSKVSFMYLRLMLAVTMILAALAPASLLFDAGRDEIIWSWRIAVLMSFINLCIFGFSWGTSFWRYKQRRKNQDITSTRFVLVRSDLPL